MDRVWKGFDVDKVPARFLGEATAVTAGATLSPSFSSLGLGWPSPGLGLFLYSVCSPGKQHGGSSQWIAIEFASPQQ